MNLPAILLIVFVVAVSTSLAVARRLTQVSAPPRRRQEERHWGSSQIPRFGGVAVFVALLVGIISAATAKGTLPEAIRVLPELAGALMIGGAILFVVGLMDDLRGVRPLVKLMAQTAAALIVYRAGVAVEQVAFVPGYVFTLGWLSLPITVLWLVGVSNAFNLIDGLDGLAGGVAILGLLAIATAAVFLGNDSVVVYTVALIGALLGFLRYNFPSARIFLGDSGSLVVGFLLAVLAVKGATNSVGVTYALVPIFGLSYLLLDTGIAILRRWLRGVPLSRADKRHIHHQLAVLGLTPHRALSVIYLASAVLAVLGLSATFAPPEVTVAVAVVGVAVLISIIALGIYWLEYHEFLEAGASVASAARKARSVIQDKINARDLAKLIFDAKSVGEIETILEDNARTFRFAHMKLSDPESRAALPGRITKELQALKLWKLEYPIVQAPPDGYDGLCLTIWCSLAASQRPAGAERVAHILAPAIEAWVREALKTQSHAELAESAKLAGSGLRRADLTLEELRALRTVRDDRPVKQPAETDESSVLA